MSEEIKKESKTEAVVSSKSIVSTKKSLGKKFADTFITEDLHDIADYAIKDIAIPGIKNAILSMIKIAFFGDYSDPIGHSNSGKTDYAGRYSYGSRRRSLSESDRNADSRIRSENRDSRYNDCYRSVDKVDPRNIVLNNRQDADRVVDELNIRIKRNGMATVADLLDLIGIPGKYTDNNYGWVDERDIRVRRISSGWLIDVSEPRYLD